MAQNSVRPIDRPPPVHTDLIKQIVLVDQVKEPAGLRAPAAGLLAPRAMQVRALGELKEGAPPVDVSGEIAHSASDLE